MYPRFFKYVFDLGVVLCILPLALPLALFTAFALAMASGFLSSIIFKQIRPGKDGKPFTIYKFKTMRDAVGADGKPLPDADRLTRVGRVVRSLSLDELPQLINVVKADMSLVGPRPLLMEYLERYTPEQARRMEVRKVNGKDIRDMKSLIAAFDSNMDELHSIEFDEENLSVYLDDTVSTAVDSQLLQRGITRLSHVE